MVCLNLSKRKCKFPDKRICGPLPGPDTGKTQEFGALEVLGVRSIGQSPGWNCNLGATQAEQVEKKRGRNADCWGVEMKRDCERGKEKSKQSVRGGSGKHRAAQGGANSTLLGALLAAGLRSEEGRCAGPRPAPTWSPPGSGPRAAAPALPAAPAPLGP